MTTLLAGPRPASLDIVPRHLLLDRQWQEDMEAVRALHNRYQGERLFLLGSGPSLREDDLTPLADEYTFGFNELLRYDGVRFMPTFYGICEFNATESANALLLGTRQPKYRFASTAWPLEERSAGWLWLYSHRFCHMADGHFAGLGDELWALAPANSAVLEVGLQLGCWMGFDPIYLLGCDNTGAKDVRNYAWDAKPDATLGGQVPTRAGEAAGIAWGIMAQNGRTLIDLTLGGLLPLPRQRLKDVLGGVLSPPPHG